MWIRKKEIEQLSAFIKGYDSGAETDIRDNQEGAFSILKNDIYSLMHTEQEQLKNIEAERDILADYMADISHQLKTPLTSMMIMTDLLEDATPEKKSEFIHNIKLSLHKTEWLVDALLKMAKIDAHAITFSKKSIKVSELIAEAKPSIAILLDVQNQTLQVENDGTITCDKRWTTEALINIIKNAIEHSPKNGCITINSGTNPLYDWITVTDSGTGMTRSSYSALFQRFEYSTNENGFGIGMPLALSIIKGQGGDIDVDFGGNGQGATFTIKLFK